MKHLETNAMQNKNYGKTSRVEFLRKAGQIMADVNENNNWAKKITEGMYAL